MVNKAYSSKVSYLSVCDFINKYNLKSIYQQPELSHIILEFPLASFLKAYDIKNISEKNTKVQIKAFLLLYFCSIEIPFITHIQIIEPKKKIANDSRFLIKVRLSTQINITTFLVSLFIENVNAFFLKKIKLFKKKKSLDLNSKQVRLSLKLPFAAIYDFNFIINNLFLDINVQELFMKVTFMFKLKQLQYKNFKKLIKNFPFFWNS